LEIIARFEDRAVRIRQFETLDLENTMQGKGAS
jgi:hypothetical protein